MTDNIPMLWSTLWRTRWDEDCFRLRFELGGEDYSVAKQAVPRALRAFTRASAITDLILGTDCVGIVANLLRTDIKSNDDIKDFNVNKHFSKLRRMGFSAPETISWAAKPYPESDNDAEDDSPWWMMRGFDLTRNRGDRDTLLWNSVVHELPISPRVFCLSFLLHSNRPVLVHVYDDRGMDVITSDRELLMPAYETFNSWLLDFDLGRMKRLFE